MTTLNSCLSRTEKSENTKTFSEHSEDNINYRGGRYLTLIRPYVLIWPLSSIAAFFFQEEFDTLSFSIFMGICWIVVSMQLGFTRFIEIPSFPLIQPFFQSSWCFTLVVLRFSRFYYQIDNTSGYVTNTYRCSVYDHCACKKLQSITFFQKTTAAI
jgi:putative colanic acid biosynthesis UDP-glucose lipid carrier transferase